MYKVILTGRVTTTPELHYAIDQECYLSVFKFIPFVDSQLDSEEFDIICNGKFQQIADKYIHKGMNLLIEGSPTVYVNKRGKTQIKGTFSISLLYLQFLDDELFLDDIDSTPDLLEFLQMMRDHINT